MGDVHPQGNPHYWLDPGNGRRIAAAIRDKLSELDRADAAYFAERYADFDKRLAEAEKRWDATMAAYKGLKLVTYHRSWPNFCERFGLEVMGYVEPKPGIPPSPSHTLELIQEMKRQNVKLILVEPYFDLKTPNSIARERGRWWCWPRRCGDERTCGFSSSSIATSPSSSPRSKRRGPSRWTSRPWFPLIRRPDHRWNPRLPGRAVGAG
jgi:hypothetical protein